MAEDSAASPISGEGNQLPRSLSISRSVNNETSTGLTESTTSASGIGNITSLTTNATPETNSRPDLTSRRISNMNLEELRNLLRENKNQLQKQRDKVKFTCFLKLPPELRIMVWKHALPGPRIVHIVREDPVPHHIPHYLAQGIASPRSYCPIPALLHVNKESRTIALKFYSLLFGTSRNRSLSQGLREREQPKIYCNLEIDIVLFHLCDLRYWVGMTWPLFRHFPDLRNGNSVDGSSSLTWGMAQLKDLRGVQRLGVIEQNAPHFVSFEVYRDFIQCLGYVIPSELYFCVEASPFFVGMSGNVGMSVHEMTDEIKKSLLDDNLNVGDTGAVGRGFAVKQFLLAELLKIEKRNMERRREREREEETVTSTKGMIQKGKGKEKDEDKGKEDVPVPNGGLPDIQLVRYFREYSQGRYC